MKKYIVVLLLIVFSKSNDIINEASGVVEIPTNLLEESKVVV